MSEEVLADHRLTKISACVKKGHDLKNITFWFNNSMRSPLKYELTDEHWISDGYTLEVYDNDHGKK